MIRPYILMEDEAADSLLVTEVITPAGMVERSDRTSTKSTTPARDAAQRPTTTEVHPAGRGFASARYTEDASSRAHAVAKASRAVTRGYHPRPPPERATTSTTERDGRPVTRVGGSHRPGRL